MGSPLPEINFQAARLEGVFGRCFGASENTRLVGGAGEPVYLPAGDGRPVHELHYREDFFASALHEVAHWCIAGRRRRQQVDFGYWYAPEGRDPAQQRAFESVEVKPQALEWIFSRACGYRFRPSVDNFNAGGTPADCRPFARALAGRARHYQRAGLPHRAQVFFAALASEFRSAASLDTLVFEHSTLP